MTDMSGMDDMDSTASGSGMMKMYFHGSIGTDTLFFASWMPSSPGAVVGVVIALFLLAVFERWVHAFRRACEAHWSKGLIGFTKPISSGPYTTPLSSSISTSHSYTDLPRPTSARQTSTFKNTYTNDLESSDPEMSSVPIYTASASTSASTSTGSGLASQRNPVIDQVGSETEKYTNAHAHLPRAVRNNLHPMRAGRWSRPFRLGVDVPRGCLQGLETLLGYLLMLVVMTFNIWWILAVVVGAGVGEMMFGRFGPVGADGVGH